MPPVNKPAAERRPTSSPQAYKTAEYPADEREAVDVGAQVLNQQSCACGHDRLCHKNTVGSGTLRRIILDCPRAGSCGVVGCKCPGFRFGKVQSAEGTRRRGMEKAKHKVIPPEA